MKDNVLALLGALAGVVVGHFLFIWIAKQGFYGPFLPDAIAGYRASWLMKRHSVPVAAVCGVIGLVAGLLSEWRAFPFIKDQGLGYFLAHIQDLRPLTLLLVGFGGFLGFWIPFRARSQ